MPIIPVLRAGVGGILPLAKALADHPNTGLTVYSRVSSCGQAGPGKVLLEEKTKALVQEVETIAPDKIRRIVSAVEEGKLAGPRRNLVDAAEFAKKNGLILVAADLSRFIRAQEYHRRTNRNAWPTSKEFAALRELTGNVTLATVADPGLSENERHAKATRRTGKAGRPRVIDQALAEKIFEDLGILCLSWCGVCRWERPLRQVAADFGVSAAAIHRASLRPSPDGRTWRERAIAKAAEEGLLIIDGNRVISLVGLPWDLREARLEEFAKSKANY